MEIPMKTITSLLTAVILLSGAASAMADQQRSDESVGYSLSLQATQGGAFASARHSGPYAAVTREPDVRTSPTGDFGNNQNAIDFQAQGSH
jgi:hypothetical protein